MVAYGETVLLLLPEASNSKELLILLLCDIIIIWGLFVNDLQLLLYRLIKIND